jgi:hypothetical protein
MDFTSAAFRTLLMTLQDNGFSFCTVKNAFAKKQDKTWRYVILRHDVDKKPENSLLTAKIESALGIKGTYYFRILPCSYDKKIIREIEFMGHEIAYHYEDLNLALQKGKSKREKTKKKSDGEISNVDIELLSVAYESFRNNLAKLREIAHIDTICMHGSPMGRIDNRILWKYYDYRDLGIIAEPYFDFEFDRMLYLTDTGRCWNGKSISIRDRGQIKNPFIFSGWKVHPIAGSLINMTETSVAFQTRFNFSSTYNIISFLNQKEMPEMMITLHPQRWVDSVLPWIGEFVGQNFKNGIKYFMSKQI